jgi:hypothetical protein
MLAMVNPAFLSRGTKLKRSELIEFGMMVYGKFGCFVKFLRSSPKAVDTTNKGISCENMEAIRRLPLLFSGKLKL